jgi:hypothetical protein
LFDYLPGQSTATFTNVNFPGDPISLTNLPAALVQQAASLVAAAGITDPNIAAGAELDYLATGDLSFVAAGADVAAQGPSTSAAPITNDITLAPALGVEAPALDVVESATGTTQVVFDAYLTNPAATDTIVSYSVVDGGTGYFGASTFGGALPSGTITIAAGQTLDPFSITLPQNALGATPNAKLEVEIASPGSVALFAPDATATVVNNTPEPGAPPVLLLAELTSFGTLIQNGNDYTLDLGSLAQGETVPLIQLGLFNEATPPADSLSGTFTAPIGNGFIVIGDALPAAIAPGADYTGLDVGAMTASTGDNSETLVFSPRDVNDTGYIGTLSPITLTIEDTVTTPAAAILNTPASLIFPNVRLGTPENSALSITNSAVAPAAGLGVTAAAFGDATVSGAISGLAPGQTDASDIIAGLDTGISGMLAGIVELTPASETGAGGTSDLPTTPQVDLFGSVYRPASPSTIAPISEIVHVGDPGTVALSVSNTDPADGYSENLVAALTGVTTGLSIASAGPTGDIAAGGSDSSLAVGFSTAQTGTITGTATVGLTTDGGTGASSIDGLGQLALAPQSVAVSVTVDNYAAPALAETAGGGTLTQSGSAYTLSLGKVTQGTNVSALQFAVENLAAGPSDNLAGTFSATGDAAFTVTGDGPLNPLSAGQSYDGLYLSLDTRQAGIDTEIIAAIVKRYRTLH